MSLTVSGHVWCDASHCPRIRAFGEAAHGWGRGSLIAWAGPVEIILSVDLCPDCLKSAGNKPFRIETPSSVEGELENHGLETIEEEGGGKR